MPLPDGKRLFLGDGGLETTMIFREGFELPCFAAFTLLRDPAGRSALRRYYAEYVAIARSHGAGFVLDTPTWRASADWGAELGYSASEIDEVNRDAVELANEIRAAEQEPSTPIVVCGTLGPRGDGYQPASLMSAVEARDYHARQVGAFAAAGVDMVAAYTLTYAEEAIGIARAAAAAETPVSISFTLETDGHLPSGEPLGEAIERVDAETAGAAAYFMVNCAHPSHFAPVVERGGPWIDRLGGFRANASRKSHAELDQATDLDSGDPAELAAEYRALAPRLPATRVLGGCCGTDRRHVARICESWPSR
jgi:S-methylmethionine-dependent homocysteine/selenocysteine methylase